MELHLFEDNSKYGFRDEKESIIIPAKYEEAKEFKEGLAIVKSNGFYGVINSTDTVVIEFDFFKIEKHNLFFECKKFKDNDNREQVCWYNKDGVLLHKGYAQAISDNFLCISNGRKQGVMSYSGIRIINFLYDEIIQKNDTFFMLRKDKIGIYDLEGNVILDAFCNSIESVIIENDWEKVGTTSSGGYHGYRYSGFCREFYFDSEDYSDTFLKKEYPCCIDFIDNPIQDINKPLIISTDNEKILFLKSEGVLLDDGFEEIQQLTSISYAVKKKNLWGVYRVDIKSFIVPIENEAIRFFGGHTILVCKDKQWGAKDILLDNPFIANYKVTISTKYLEIDILDEKQFYFGCKKIDEYNGKQCYTIIKSNGKEIDFLEFNTYNTPFKYYDSSHILTSTDDKFGFVSTKGYTSIPFKYDEIHRRRDGRFDVRIKDKWGLLTLDGRDTFGINNAKPLPNNLDKNVIVQDSESEYFGVIDSNGVVIIPAIYEHLFHSEDNEFFYFLYNGVLDGNCSCRTESVVHDFNLYSDGNSYKNTSGVVNSNGIWIINGEYGSFEMKEEYIIAGRDGTFNYWAGSVYDGVYA